MTDERVLVVGTGPIARRHLANTRSLLPGAALAVLRRPESRTDRAALAGLVDAVFEGIDDGLAWGPTHVVVANASSAHGPVAQAFVDAGTPTLVEKPLTDEPGAAQALARRPGATELVSVAYNLRHHRCLQVLRSQVAAGAIGTPLTASATVGQDLAQWRPGVDPRSTVSAIRSLGGGVLKELSHELDYLGWALGEVAEVTTAVQSAATWGPDVEDVADVGLRHRGGWTSVVHLDMVDRWPHRGCRVVGAEATLVVDLLAGTVVLGTADARSTVCEVVPGEESAATYVRLLESFFGDGGAAPTATLEEGVRVVELIAEVRLLAAGDPVARL